MKTAIALMAALALAGCANNRPTADQLAHADYGPYPNAPEDIVHAYYSGVLKDPGSVEYRQITVPHTFWYAGRFQEPRYGYMVCATYNAKNSYGGYVGFKTDGLMIRYGQVVEVFEGGVRFGLVVC